MTEQPVNCANLSNKLNNINSTCEKLEQDLNYRLENNIQEDSTKSSSSINIVNNIDNTNNSIFPNLSDLMTSSNSIEDFEGFPVFLLIFITIIVNIFIAIILSPVISAGIIIIIYLILAIAAFLLYLLSTNV